MGKDICIKKIMSVRLDDMILLHTIRTSYEYAVTYHYDTDSDDETGTSFRLSSVDVRQMPICLYKDNKFKNLKVEERYKPILDMVLADHGKSLSDVRAIHKIEERDYNH